MTNQPIFENCRFCSCAIGRSALHLLNAATKRRSYGGRGRSTDMPIISGTDIKRASPLLTEKGLREED